MERQDTQTEYGRSREEGTRTRVAAGLADIPPGEGRDGCPVSDYWF